jgi:hypothetical protein
MEYVTRRRLTLAGEALLRTGKAIIDIAQEFGYDSREGFTRSFKAYMGVSPSKYRKYGLTAISQTIAKERQHMMYSKTTDEILRELNSFVVQARETSAPMRKFEIPGFPAYTMFWNRIADRIDALASDLNTQLGRIVSIAEHPDEITNRFNIVKVIDEVAFETNLLGFNAGLMVARSRPEQIPNQEPLAQSCLELARTATIQAGKVTAFLSELAALIFADMRETAGEKLDAAIAAGKKATASIIGYDYIRDEVAYLTDSLTSISTEEITASWLDDCLFKLNIISSAAQLQDVPRTPSDADRFDGLSAFAEALRDACDFFGTLPQPENTKTMERSDRKFLMDVTFQQNIMLFYTRGEIEKMRDVPDDAQKAALQSICEAINNTIQLARAATEKTACKEIADKLHSIYADMLVEADSLHEHGGAIRFLAVEFKALGDHVARYGE